MSLVINTNVASISAQNSIGRAQMDQNEAMERLTTGKRINTAADDAAGLSIANKMTSQVKGLNQAVRNANDGISMLQTAAGALEEGNNILQRMRELAVQSASGTYDQGNRDSMQAEVEQLKDELDRIADTTTFNGQEIMNGKLGEVALQVGSNSNETIDFEIGSIKTKDLGSGSGALIIGTESTLNFTAKDGAVVTGTSGQDFTINGQTVADADLVLTKNMNDFLAEIEDAAAGIEARSFVEARADAVGDGIIASDKYLDITVLNNDGTEETYSVSGTANMDDLVSQIEEVSHDRLSATVGDDGKLVITAMDAAELTIADSSTNDNSGFDGTDANHFATITYDNKDGSDTAIEVRYGAAADGEGNAMGISSVRKDGSLVGDLNAVAGNAALNTGDVKINGVDLGAYSITTDYNGDGTTNDAANLVAWINTHTSDTNVVASLVDSDNGTADFLQLTATDGNPISLDYSSDPARVTAMETAFGMQEFNASVSSGGSISAIDISSAAGAQRAIDTIDAAIEDLSATQGELGAVNNRLDFTVSNLSNVSENAAAARSRIQDADFAAESANLSRAQVLQQAGQAMLAQANSAPQQVLSLLQ